MERKGMENIQMVKVILIVIHVFWHTITKENWSSTESGFSQSFFSIIVADGVWVPCYCRFGLLIWGQLIFSNIIDLIAQRLWIRRELRMMTSLSTNLEMKLTHSIIDGLYTVIKPNSIKNELILTE